MFSSLSSKLIAAFALVIFLCLFLAGSAFLYLLREYQTRLALNRLADLALPVALQVRVLERSGATPEQMALVLREQAADMGIRILLLDDQARVVADTQGGLEGQQIRLPDVELSDRGRAAYFGTYHDRDKQSLYFVATRPRQPPLAERFLPRTPNYSVVLAVPKQSVTAAWLELAPSLSVAALLSLVVSTAVALFLSRSISEPLAEITRASEAMARGQYDQAIPVRSRDEVGRLAQAFNTMAREVARSHRTLRDFLANVSHELKTPLTSIQGFSQAMVDGALHTPADYAEAGRIINDEAVRMRRLVEDLLYLSKVESGQLTLERQRVDMVDLLRDCLRRWQRKAAEAGVELHFCTNDSVPATVDAYRLQQVFDNLLDNAIKHTPEKGSITVRLEDQSEGRDKGQEDGSRVLAISVHNTGSFIPPEDRPRVFERFYQTSSSSARKMGGTGLGLAIVKEIVEAHGGTVAVNSDPQKGTEFIVTLPSANSTARSSEEEVGLLPGRITSKCG